jgi:hypothetical protein
MTSLSETSLLAGSSGVTSGYTIDQSIRFHNDDSPSLDKTYSGAGSRTTQTFSIWFKLGDPDGMGSGMPFFNGGAGTSDTTWTGFSWYDGKIYIQGYNTNWRISTAQYRDPSAWYHFVYNWDTTNGIDDERVRAYVNGERVTSFSTYNNPGASASSGIGQAAKHSIGYQSRTVGFGYADAYYAEIHYLDGYAYGPEYFGEFKEGTDIWIPKEYEGSYGTNGFFIDGRDSGDLGDDESGQGNDFSATNLAAHDQVADTPTNNFCTINPLYRGSHATAADYGVAGDGNLELRFSGASNGGTLCTQLMTSGKWYWEVRMEAGGGSSSYFNGTGIAAVNNGYTKADSNHDGSATGEIGFNSYNGQVQFSNTTTKTYSEVPLADGDIIGVAVDVDNGAIYYSKNGTFMGSGNPASGASKTNAGATWTPATYSGGWVPTIAALGGSVPIVTMNFGQEGTFSGTVSAGGNSDGNGIGNFKYSVPSGYLALCTSNLGS